MGKIWFTSDLHFNHDRGFIFQPRGFDNVYEMNETIIKNWNEIVNCDDDVYCLGDLMLGNNDVGLSCIKQLKGKIHIVRGNHDTDSRMQLYSQCYNVVEITEGQFFKWERYHFYLSHFPTFTSNLEKRDRITEHIVNLYGHTHQKDNFYNDIPFMYHVGVDSHDCKPILIQNILADIRNKVEECKKYI